MPWRLLNKKLREKRDALIVQLSEQGLSDIQIAAQVQITPARVHGILKERRSDAISMGDCN